MIPNMMMIGFRLKTEAEIDIYRKHLESDKFPIMGIDGWSDKLGKMPVGFAKCDGHNGAPDLLDRTNLDEYYIMKTETVK